jgi:hypothetical protein
MTWAAIAVGLAAGADWRRLAILGLSLQLPLLALPLIWLHWWRQRPDRSMRAVWFCEAVSTELRAGSSLRWSIETAARSVDAVEIAVLCRRGDPMGAVGRSAQVEFPEIGEELGAILSRSDGIGIRPAALFDEVGDVAMAQVQVAHEVATASAAGKAAGFVLLAVPVTALAITATRGGFGEYLAQSAQRGAAIVGAALTAAGLISAVLVLRRSR